MKKCFESNSTKFDDATAAASVGSIRRSTLNERLVRKKLDKIHKNSAHKAINTKIQDDSHCVVSEHLCPTPSLAVQSSPRDGKSEKVSGFDHFLSEIRERNIMLHHMSKGLVTIKELWTECFIGMSRGPVLR